MGIERVIDNTVHEDDSEEEVIEQILTMNVQEECEKTRDMIKNKLTYIGGHATEICVEKLLGGK